jgi:hypothetical protein
VERDRRPRICADRDPRGREMRTERFATLCRSGIDACASKVTAFKRVTRRGAPARATTAVGSGSQIGKSGWRSCAWASIAPNDLTRRPDSSGAPGAAPLGD